MARRWHCLNMSEEDNFRRGILIAIEGTDGSHKSYLCDRLVGYLSRKMYPTKIFRFPDRTTEIGKLIDCYLKGKIAMTPHVIHLLFSANRMEKAITIENLLNQGYHIIVDRWLYSGIAYSLAKNARIMDITPSWSAAVERTLPEPDLIFWPKFSSDYILKNSAKYEGRGEIFDTAVFQAKVSDQFEYLSTMPSVKHLWKVENAEEKSREDIFDSVCKTVEAKILANHISTV